MSDESVDAPQPRNDDNQIQNGGNQMIPLPNNPPPPLVPAARRILMIQRENDVVSVLSAISSSCRQPIYILSGMGYVRQIILTGLPSGQQVRYSNGVGEILYLSGWFQPIMVDIGWHGAFSRPNGVLNVSLSALPPGAYVANRLIAFGFVQVYVVFICAPGSVIPPDAWHAQPIRINIPSPQ